MNDNEPILVVENVEKSYGKVKALNGMSLVIRPGEFVAMVGLNGAGKSTLMNLLTGLFTADSGSIRIFDRDMAHDPVGALAHIGVIFQHPTLDLELTVRANLLYHADMHGIDRPTAKARIDEELTRVGLKDQLNTLVRHLSGGNRRRVELARALLHRPSLLLSDEATVGLDPGSRAGILEHMHELQGQSHLGILWTTHLIDEADRADRIVVLHRGRVLFDGAPPALLERERVPSLQKAFLAMTGQQAVPAAPAA
jgi:ABC-2 type transport system ATP-binding protein